MFLPVVMPSALPLHGAREVAKLDAMFLIGVQDQHLPSPRFQHFSCFHTLFSRWVCFFFVFFFFNYIYSCFVLPTVSGLTLKLFDFFHDSCRQTFSVDGSSASLNATQSLFLSCFFFPPQSLFLFKTSALELQLSRSF